MTTRFSAASASYESAANTESAPARIADEGPYARPASTSPQRAVDAVLIDAIRASVGPFVPPQWRTESVELPWIESFMEHVADEHAAEEADALTTAELRGTGEANEDAAVVAETAPEAVTVADTEAASEAVVEGQSTPTITEEWPLEEAGAAMRALADDLVRQEDPTTGATEPEAASQPLPMWSDDDVMDIMPVKPAEAAAAAIDEPWAARARRETEAAGSPEAAARALETLAGRVRSGEIQLPVFSAEMGEAAALSAALAALLSVRR